MCSLLALNIGIKLKKRALRSTSKKTVAAQKAELAMMVEPQPMSTLVLGAAQANRLDLVAPAVHRICMRIYDGLDSSSIPSQRELVQQYWNERQPWTAGTFGTEIARRVQLAENSDQIPVLFVMNAGFLSETLDIKVCYSAITGSNMLVYAFESNPELVDAFHSKDATFYDTKDARAFNIIGSSIFVNACHVAAEDTIPFKVENLDELYESFDTYSATSVLICHSDSGLEDSVTKQLYLAVKCQTVSVLIISNSALENVNKSVVVLPKAVAKDSFVTSYYNGGVTGTGNSRRLKVCTKKEYATFYSFHLVDVRAQYNGRYSEMLGHHITLSHKARVELTYGFIYISCVLNYF